MRTTAPVNSRPAGVAAALGRIWRRKRLVWHMVERDLAENRTLSRMAGIGVLLLLLAYAWAFFIMRPSGATVGGTPLTDAEVGIRVAFAALFGVLLNFSVFLASYTAQRAQGSLKGFFCHPVGVAEVVAAKLLYVLVICAVVTAIVLLPLLPTVQAGVMPAGRAAALSVLIVSAQAASYMCLVAGVALAFLIRDRAERFRPEHGVLVSIAIFILDSRYLLTGACERLLSFRAEITKTAVSAADVRAASDWAAALSAPSPFEAAHNLARAAFGQPAFPWGIVVSVALFLAVAVYGISRAHRTYPEEVF